MKKIAEDEYKYDIPELADELKHATTDREKAYLNYIKELSERLKRDSATGLEHRQQFEKAKKSDGAFIFIDGDGLKTLNDKTQDHNAGDAAIKALAQGIKSALRARDDVQVARMGGDEFVVFISGISVSAGVQIAKRILESIRKQKITDFYVGDNQKSLEFLKNWNLTASIGVGKTKEDADQAMYNAKMKGRDRVEFALKKAAEAALRVAKLVIEKLLKE